MIWSMSGEDRLMVWVKRVLELLLASQSLSGLGGWDHAHLCLGHVTHKHSQVYLQSDLAQGFV